MSRNVVKKTRCDDFHTCYGAATDDIKDFSFLFEEIVITKMIHSGSLDATEKPEFQPLITIGHFYIGTDRKYR